MGGCSDKEIEIEDKKRPQLSVKEQRLQDDVARIRKEKEDSMARNTRQAAASSRAHSQPASNRSQPVTTESTASEGGNLFLCEICGVFKGSYSTVVLHEKECKGLENTDEVIQKRKREEQKKVDVGDGSVLVPAITEIFKLMDANSDGIISAQEGLKVGLALGLDEEASVQSWNEMCESVGATRYHQMVRSTECDGSNSIDLAEWMQFYKGFFKGCNLLQANEMLEEMASKMNSFKQSEKSSFESMND